MFRSIALNLVLFLIILHACTDKKFIHADPAYANAISADRLKKDQYVLSNGIIEQADIAAFKGLQYYEPDSNFIIKAKVSPLPPIQVEFKTTTEDKRQYFTQCLLEFKIGDTSCTLIAYSSDLNAGEGLFIPFKDATSNKESYGGGRYIESEYKTENGIYILDFNRAFNPYCHYNHSYSCPIVPAENNLKVAIRAGEKKLHD